MRDIKTLIRESMNEGFIPSVKYFFKKRDQVIPLGILHGKIFFHGFISSLRKSLLRTAHSGTYTDGGQDTVWYAFYDLAVSPPTYDIIDFLLLAEYHCCKKKSAYLHVIFVPGYDDGFRAGDYASYIESSRKQKTEISSYMEWRVRNILVPSCWLFSSCRMVTVCPTRQEAERIEFLLAGNVYPQKYSVRYPLQGYDQRMAISLASGGAELSSISVPYQAGFFVKNWIGSVAEGKKVVVITLRESSYQAERNSNIPAWAEFARTLNTGEYYPVFIRDTERGLEDPPAELSGFPIVTWACFNVELRAALYELCYLNMSVNNGTMELCIHNPKTRYINFKMITEAYGSTSQEHFLYIGIKPGTQPVFCTRYQKWVWKSDTTDVIIDEFKQMEERIHCEAGN